MIKNPNKQTNNNTSSFSHLPQLVGVILYNVHLGGSYGIKGRDLHTPNTFISQQRPLTTIYTNYTRKVHHAEKQQEASFEHFLVNY